MKCTCFKALFRLFLVPSLLFLIIGCGGGGGGGGSGSSKGVIEEIDNNAVSSYERETLYNPDGSQKGGYGLVAKNAKGSIIQESTCHSPGGDGQWFTKDDAMYGYWKSSYDELGRLTEYAHYVGVGQDGKFFTDDDIQRTSYHLSNKNGNIFEFPYYSDPGRDLTWNTGDDISSNYYYYEYTYDDSGRETGKLYRWYDYDYMGTVMRSEKYMKEYENGNLVREGYSGGAGQDGIWFTTDDSESEYTVYTYLEGRLEEESKYYLSGYSLGIDEEWMTGDDISDEYITYVYESGKKVSGVMHYRGNDSLWNTSDDQAGTCVTYEYNTVDGCLVAANHYSRGPDQVWGTTDDYRERKVEYLKQLTMPGDTGVLDTTPPAVISTIPEDNATGVSVNTGVVFSFSDHDYILYKSIVSVSGIEEEDLIVGGSSWATGSTINVFFGILSPGTTYTVTLAGLTDLYGNVMPTKTLTFTTAE